MVVVVCVGGGYFEGRLLGTLGKRVGIEILAYGRGKNQKSIEERIDLFFFKNLKIRVSHTLYSLA